MVDLERILAVDRTKVMHRLVDTVDLVVDIVKEAGAAAELQDVEKDSVLEQESVL